jgi:hypothetical protein
MPATIENVADVQVAGVSRLVPAIGSSAGFGYFVGLMVNYPEQGVPSSIAAMIANAVYAGAFMLPFPVTVNTVAMRMGVVGGASSVCNLGIYDKNQNKLIEASFDATITTAQFKTPTIGAGITLPPDGYFFAWSASDATMQPAGYGTSSGIYQGLGLYGRFINTMSGNIMPASLGGFTAALGGGFPFALFYT